MTATRRLPLPDVHQISRGGVMVAKSVQWLGQPRQRIFGHVGTLAASKCRGARDSARELVLVEIVHVGDIAARRQVMPAVGAFDQRCAAEGSGRVLPAEREVHLLPIVDSARLDQRFARATKVGALFGAYVYRPRPRPDR